MATRKYHKKASSKKTPQKRVCHKMTETVSSYKPSMTIPAEKLGKSAKVGKKASVTITGTVIEEEINRYDNNKHSFRVEIDKIRKPSKPKPKRR